MAEYIYNFTIDQFPNNKYDLSKLDKEIRDSSITVSLSHLNGSESDVDAIFRNPLIYKDLTTLSGVVEAHDGEDDYLDYDPVKIMAADAGVSLDTHLTDVPYDRSGKLRVHQTSRKLGTRIMWMGVGDDPTDITKAGGGESISFAYTVGQTEPLVKYIDFNIATNETWLHEGYLTWNNAQLDTLTLEMVPRTVTVSGSTNTFYNLYGGYLVVPAAGDGYTELLSDITQPNGGLVYMPDNDLGESPQAFWNADFNESTGLYENITAAPYGNGRYNMFAAEVVFARFINTIPLLANGFIALNSSDTDQMGQGMRLKMIADTNTETADDHDWSVACIMCLHRDRSV